MKNRMQILLRLVFGLSLAASLVIVYPRASVAFTIGNPGGGRTRHVPAVRHRKRVRFLAWHGDKLVTTAGVFTITKSVKVVDLAGTRSWKGNRSGRLPAVHCTYRNGKLIKVVIK